MPAQDVLQGRIAELYKELLETALDSPETFARVVNERVTTLVPSHGTVMILDAEEHTVDTVESVAHISVGRLTDEEPAVVRLEQVAGGRDLLARLMASSEQDLEDAMRHRYPDYETLQTRWFLGSGNPNVAIGICRVQNSRIGLGPFSADDDEAIERLGPHLVASVRVYAELTRTRRATFDFFVQRCREVAQQFDLTSTESRVLQMIVEGEANKSIGEGLGITLPTVKTHITHILQKTGCRNRSDLIGKYFSSRNVPGPR